MPPKAAAASSLIGSFNSRKQNVQRDVSILNSGGQALNGQLQYTSEVVVVQTVPKVIVHACFVIDASGSMAIPTDKGISRMETVLQYVKHMAENVLCPTDRITVAFFNVNYQQVWHKAPVSSILKDFDRLRTQARALLAAPQGTKLWDCSLKALHSMQKTERGVVTDSEGNTVLRFMVVFTDGEDNQSTAQLPQVVQEVAKPGFGCFKFLCLVVGAPAMASQVQSAFQKVQLARVIGEAGCSANDIKKAFGRANQAMRQAKEELVETLQLIIRNGNKNAKPSMHEVIGSVAGLQLNNQQAIGNGGRSQSAQRGRSQSAQRGRPAQEDDDSNRGRPGSRAPSAQRRPRSNSRRRD